jgi:hypothetical protein
MNDKIALQASSAGMRLIAQTTLYNAGNDERLQSFIADSYAPDLLEQQTAEAKTAAFAHMREVVGRIKIVQVLGAEKHHVAVIMAGEKYPEGFVVEMRVGEDYPHKIQYYMQKPVETTE